MSRFGDYYILFNEEDRDRCRQECFNCWMALHPESSKYINDTNCWSLVVARATDGAWIVPVCEAYSNPNNYPIETKTTDWN